MHGVQNHPTHELTVTELLFEYVELFARNTSLDTSQLARRTFLHVALTKSLRVNLETYQERMVAPLIAASELARVEIHGTPRSILNARINLKKEIESVEQTCFRSVECNHNVLQ